MYKHFFKRFFDIVLSVIGLSIALLPMLIIALLIKIDSKGPVIFKQQRIGKNGKVFNIYKFRSMCVGAEKKGSGVYSGKGDARVTKIGRILRATSLDEIPQFFNLLKGDMSFIGPRPPLTYHPWKWEEYTDEQKRMFEVRPGITGWAQVNGRKDVEWNRRIELNVWYVDHVSLWLDIKIIFKTIGKVFSNADNANTKETVVKKPEPATEQAAEATAQEVQIAKEELAEVAVTESSEAVEEKTAEQKQAE
ncbi:MAG: sugar transferase [Clostridia bacterium]|nr:sugar transferase [Clostridia bacterium]